MRGKPEFKKAIRVSLILEEEDFEHVRRAAVDLSTQMGRIVTPSEAMRLALIKCYKKSEEMVVK
jgi:hypothetical protein